MRSVLVELKQGFKIGDQMLKTLTLRQPRVADLIAAEQTIPANGKEIAFRAALIAVCIENLDGYDGVVTQKMVTELSINDYAILFDALNTLENEETEETKKD
ncbi:phage tail assembly protein [Snodgrassella sp. B3088]|uniref:phage tail assembly protein n=1 Tax=Snodgrassella TaxID=1193515 RepID=UPI0022699BC8|nr:phage tail assembly protein [Snodgrassella sp. B3088]MCX8749245.1 phage tail assembly protein [Snodgrassella sp. B3088]